MKRIRFPGPYRFDWREQRWVEADWSSLGRQWYSPGNKANWGWKGHWGVK